MPILDSLKQHRDAVLLAEIGVLLHDIGKLSEEFIGHSSLEKSPEKFSHRKAVLDEIFIGKAFKQILEDTSLTKCVNNLTARLKYLPLKSFIDLIVKHQGGNKEVYSELLRLLRTKDDGVDGLDSGVDKGAAKHKQHLNTTRIVSAFGYEKKSLDGSSNYLTDLRKILCDKLTESLTDIAADSSVIKEKRKDILEAVEDAYKQALGETRCPANDVTLWDHSYSVATLYKSALAKLIIENAQNKNPKLTEPIDIKWRILRVNLDVLGIYSKAHKIGDILGYQEKIFGLKNETKSLFNKVKQLIEVDLALGNELYHDESGIYFTFPDVGDSSKKLLKEIKPLIEKIFGDFDVTPSIGLSEPERSLTELGNQIDKAYKEYINQATANPKVNKWIEDWEKVKNFLSGEIESPTELKNIIADFDQDKRTGQCSGIRCDKFSSCIVKDKHNKLKPDVEVCPICQVRPKCEYQEYCQNCAKRRTSRVNAWLKDDDNKSSIWLDEVADKNGRLALITGHFTLTNWLNGRYVDSMMIQVPQDSEQDHDNQDRLFSDITNLTRRVLTNNGDDDLYDLDGGYHDGITGDEQQWKNYLKTNVRDKNFRKKFADLPKDNSTESVDYLAYHYLTKNPSPARLRRVWETTDEFWEQIVDKDIIQHKSRPQSDKLNSQRLFFEPINGAADDLSALAYDSAKLKSGNKELTSISVYWHKERKIFISIVNLEYIAQSLSDGERKIEDYAQLEDSINSKTDLILEIDTKKLGAKADETKIKVKLRLLANDEIPSDIKHLKNYRRSVTILKSPHSYMAIVPADDLMAVSQKISDSYLVNFAKVRNRLPIHLRATFFNRRQPLYIAVDAARRMLRYRNECNGLEAKEQNWQVAEVTKKRDDKYQLNLKPTPETTEFQDRLSYPNLEIDITKHPNTHNGMDEEIPYYAYFNVIGGNDDIESRPHYIKGFDIGNEPANWVAVDDLKPGDKIKFNPSTFDFEFLDSSAARFDIDLEIRDKLRLVNGESIRSKRPFLLEDISYFIQLWDFLRDNEKITNTSLSNFNSLLIDKFIALNPTDNSALFTPTNRQELFNWLASMAIDNFQVAANPDISKDNLESAINSGYFFDVIELYTKILKYGK